MQEKEASATKSTHLIGTSKRGPSVSNIEKLKKYFAKINVHSKPSHKKASNNSD